MLKQLLYKFLNIGKARGLVLVALILAAMCAGLYFRFFTSTVDSHLEQIAEEILDDYGIKVDFSEKKKENN